MNTGSIGNQQPKWGDLLAAMGMSPGAGSATMQQPAPDVGSSATGAAQPGDTVYDAGTGTFGRAGTAKQGTNVGAAPPPGAFASNGPANGNVSVGNNWWDTGTAGNEYGPAHLLASPQAWWQSYAMHNLGLGPLSGTGQWLASVSQDPVGLSRVTGLLNGGVASNDQELSAMNALGGLLGKNASFSPSGIIKTTLEAIANFNPNQKGASTGQGNALALQLYDPDPMQMAGNIVNFFQGVLSGVVPPDTLNQIKNALMMAAQSVNAKAINTPGTTLVSDRPGQGVAQQFMGILHQFGLV